MVFLEPVEVADCLVVDPAGEFDSATRPSWRSVMRIVVALVGGSASLASLEA